MAGIASLFRSGHTRATTREASKLERGRSPRDTLGNVRLRLGTRGSPLALAQSHEVRRRLLAAHGWGEDAVSITTIRTSGDRIQDRPLAEAGGKGLFTKELEEALLDGRIDIAVHSMKDMPTTLPEGLAIAAMLEREDVRDAFISLRWPTVAALPHGARVGSSSLRRQAQLRHRRSDLEVVMYRGNVETRLRKLADGVVDATLLAVAGLRRLGLADRITATIDVDDMLPAVGQGAVGIEARASDGATVALLAPLDHAPTSLCVGAERVFLAGLEGSCRTPIAGLAELVDGAIRLRGEILSPDGAAAERIDVTGSPKDALRLAADAAAALRRRAPDLVPPYPSAPTNGV